MMDIIYILFLGVVFYTGFVAGMYVVTQISEWITKQKKKK